jgi:hypothetical protein
MPLKQSDINELKGIYKQDYGKELSNQEAWELGITLFELGKLLLQGYEKMISDGKKRSP